MKVLAVSILLVATLASCGQTNKVKTNATGQVLATYYLRLPGTIAVDPNGNEMPYKIDTVYTIYVETKATDKIDWNTACINGQHYTIHPHPTKEKEILLNSYSGSEVINVSTSAGMQWWLISLSPIAEKTNVPADSSWVEFSLEGKKIRKPIEKIIQVTGIPSV